ncbi:MAG: DNA cytosine methyltransferase, partial [Oscillospiraceae bacterium]|nr:DNA cytosine methyltransferase [Oscillospiraceae bacterium]
KYWRLPPYSQIIEPYMFGHPWKKRTCLWLKGLPELKATNNVKPEGCWTIMKGGKSCRVKTICEGGARNAKERARTFPGIARAMAEQWGGDVRGGDTDDQS